MAMMSLRRPLPRIELGRLPSANIFRVLQGTIGYYGNDPTRDELLEEARLAGGHL
jgi:hypothetical protein